MPDIITCEERSLIDQAIAENRYTVCPTLVPMPPAPPPPPQEGKDPTSHWYKRIPYAERMAQIRTLILAKKSAPEIAQELNINRNYVYQVLYDLKKTEPDLVLVKAPRGGTAALKRLARIQKLLDNGTSIADIARSLNMNANSAATYIRNHRAKGDLT